MFLSKFDIIFVVVRMLIHIAKMSAFHPHSKMPLNSDLMHISDPEAMTMINAVIMFVCINECFRSSRHRHFGTSLGTVARAFLGTFRIHMIYGQILGIPSV